jgi:general stress protein YciG
MQNKNSGGNRGKESSNRGFASMDPEQQREISREGGKASHEKGTGHEWNSQEAREAGKKGGKASGGGRRQGL